MANKKVTMADLLAKSEMKLVVPKKGDKLVGKITKIGKRFLSVDLGAKTEGVVADKEFQLAKEYIQDLKEGQDLEVNVVSSENDRGQIVLSLKRAAIDAKWELFEEAFEKDEELEVKGLEVNKGGLIVGIQGVRGFIPSSQFSKQYLGKLPELKNKKIKVKVIEVDKEKNRLIFSERHVSEAEEIAQKQAALNQVKTGKNYDGVVSGVMPFGLFVTVEVPIKNKQAAQIEGLVHISEISWEKVENPKDYYKQGDKIKVKLLDVDEQSGKLNLSVKQLSNDPWLEIDKKYQAGTTFTGVVTRVEPFGVFINAEPGVDGLMHQSKMEAGKKYEKGEEVTVSVESVDPHERRMSLSPVLVEVPVGYK